MNINELFEKIQNELNDNLRGEFTLHGNCIIWSYDLEKDSEEIEYSEDDDEFNFYDNSTSSEELLIDVYNEDIEKFEEFLDEIEETDNWNTSDYEISGNNILFKIF